MKTIIQAYDGNLQELCVQADWDDNLTGIDFGNSVPESVLDARESIMRSIIRGASAYYLLTGDTGYAYAAEMFSRFLDGNDKLVAFRFSQGHAFANDPWIARATRSLDINYSNTGDDPDVIIPLMRRFLINHVQSNAINSPSGFNAGPVPLNGKDSYLIFEERDTGLEPRANDPGYWAAFGHVTINGNFYGEGKYSCTYKSYLTDVTANYHIDDRYEWYPEKMTPLPFPGVTEGAKIFAPHLWWISLINSTPPRANEFDITIDWMERDVVSSKDFSGFQFVPRFMLYLP